MKEHRIAVRQSEQNNLLSYQSDENPSPEQLLHAQQLQQQTQQYEQDIDNDVGMVEEEAQARQEFLHDIETDVLRVRGKATNNKSIFPDQNEQLLEPLIQSFILFCSIFFFDCLCYCLCYCLFVRNVY